MKAAEKQINIEETELTEITSNDVVHKPANNNVKLNKRADKRGICLTPRIEMSEVDKKRLKTLLEAFRYFKLMTKTRREFLVDMYDQLVINDRTPTVHQMIRLRETLTFTNLQIFPNDTITPRRIHKNKEKCNKQTNSNLELNACSM